MQIIYSKKPPDRLSTSEVLYLPDCIFCSNVMTISIIGST